MFTTVLVARNKSRQLARLECDGYCNVETAVQQLAEIVFFGSPRPHTQTVGSKTTTYHFGNNYTIDVSLVPNGDNHAIVRGRVDVTHLFRIADIEECLGTTHLDRDELTIAASSLATVVSPTHQTNEDGTILFERKSFTEAFEKVKQDLLAQYAVTG